MLLILLFVSFLQKLALCKMGPLFMQYVVGANSYWLLVEGIYLYRLLVATVLFEKHQLLRYIFIGWGKFGLFQGENRLIGFHLSVSFMIGSAIQLGQVKTNLWFITCLLSC